MIPFLLVISFLLHGVLLIAIITLSLRVKKTQEIEKRQAQVAKEIEDTFTAYLLEFKEENERLLNKLEENGDNGRGAEERWPEPTIGTDRIKENVPSQEESTLLKEELPSSSEKNELSYTPPLPEEDGAYEPSIESQIYQLYDQGHSVEEIAKRLDRGKTEVELILKFKARMS